jgi:methionyl aminopeptidase
VIQKMADKAKFGVVKDFVGHGVGRQFHSMPFVQHNRNSDRTKMVEGMTFTIEPMLTEGTSRTRMWDDNWTVVTVDGKLSAQYEHTLLITSNGCEILTPWPENR